MYNFSELILALLGYVQSSQSNRGRMQNLREPPPITPFAFAPPRPLVVARTLNANACNKVELKSLSPLDLHPKIVGTGYES